MTVAEFYVRSLITDRPENFYHSAEPLAELSEWDAEIAEVVLHPASVYLRAQFPDKSEVSITRMFPEGYRGSYNAFRVLPT
jgi:hypothetical protein